MSGFIVRQPNGKLCRFSSVTDCPTHWNMTDEEYIKYCIDQARKEARDLIDHHLRPFSMIQSNFLDNNMSKRKFNEMLKEMKDPRGKFNQLNNL